MYASAINIGTGIFGSIISFSMIDPISDNLLSRHFLNGILFFLLYSLNICAFCPINPVKQYSKYV